MVRLVVPRHRIARFIQHLVVSQSLTILLIACTDEVALFECPAPGEEYVAVYYNLSGGGAAGINEYYVAVESKDRKRSWRVFHTHGSGVRLIWLDATHLQIEYPPGDQVIHWQNTFGDYAEGHTSLAVPPKEVDITYGDIERCVVSADATE